MAENETPKLSVFDRLKKLFNGSIIYRPLGSSKIKVVDPNRLQSSGARSNTRLMDKFGRLYSNNSSAFSGVGVTEESAQITKMQLYADYENMDTDAIISSALDIVADECLSGETVIPLLDGRKLTIAELYEMNLKDFWVYGRDDDGNFKPAKCERVAHNGIQSTDEIMLEDGTIMRSTQGHQWMMSDGTLKFTKDLEVGDSISALRTQDSTYKHRITRIKRNVTEEAVYDLVNVEGNHIYAVECQDGSKLFTHNCTTKNERGDILQIRSEHEDVKEHLENLFHDILDIEFNLWPWIRSMCKYGDMYLGLDVREKYGIVGAIPLSNYFMQRIEGSDEDPYETTFKLVDFTNMSNGGYGNYNRYGNEADVTVFEQYEIAHFRLLNDVNFLPYGKSYLEGARKLFKQLCLDENTNIWTPTGCVKIKDIKIGDEIYSFNYETGEKVVNKVKNHILTGNKETYEVKTSHRTIRGTKEHPLMIEGGIYKNIGDLTTDDKLVLPTNIKGREYICEKITKIIKHEECTNVYDIEVESDLHNFIADGLIAHNCLMEDAMLLHRIMRAPEKRLFKIDVGGLSQDEIAPYMENIINKIKKTPFQDPETGEYNLNFNLDNMTEDYFMPVRGSEVNNGIESINGLQYDMIDDIDYLKGKLFAALKAPKAFLGYEDGIDGTSVLSQQDVRFARTIERIQKMAINELTKMAIIHLYTKGIASEKLVEFDLQLTIPSIIAEQEKISLFNEKVSLASQMKDLKMISRDFIYSNVFNFSKQEAQEEAEKSIEDIKTLFRETQIENEGNDPKITGESYGTAHDIASMHTTRKFEPQDMGGSEPGGQPGAGRPRTHTKYGAWNHPNGPDPLGKKNIKKVYDYEDTINHAFKANGIKQAVASKEGKETDKKLVKEEKVRLNTHMTRKRKAIIESLKKFELDVEHNKDRFIQARNNQLKSNALIKTYKLESGQPNQARHKFLEELAFEREQEEMEDFLNTTFLNTDKLEDK